MHSLCQPGLRRDYTLASPIFHFFHSVKYSQNQLQYCSKPSEALTDAASAHHRTRTQIEIPCLLRFVESTPYLFHTVAQQRSDPLYCFYASLTNYRPGRSIHPMHHDRSRPVSPAVHHNPTKKLIIRAFTRSIKNPHTSGTTIKARCAAPYCLATAVMLTIAVAVEPRVMPPKPALMTVAS